MDAQGWTRDVRLGGLPEPRAQGPAVLIHAVLSTPPPVTLQLVVSSGAASGTPRPRRHTHDILMGRPLVLRVLAVEDDPFAQSMYHQLAKGGQASPNITLQIEVVATVTAALKWLDEQTEHPDIVILDVMLSSGINGDDAIRPLRAILGDGAVIVCVSGHTQVRSSGSNQP